MHQIKKMSGSVAYKLSGFRTEQIGAKDRFSSFKVAFKKLEKGGKKDASEWHLLDAKQRMFKAASWLPSCDGFADQV